MDKRREIGDLIIVLKYLKYDCMNDKDKSFSVVGGDRSRSSGIN